MPPMKRKFMNIERYNFRCRIGLLIAHMPAALKSYNFFILNYLNQEHKDYKSSVL